MGPRTRVRRDDDGVVRLGVAGLRVRDVCDPLKLLAGDAPRLNCSLE